MILLPRLILSRSCARKKSRLAKDDKCMAVDDMWNFNKARRTEIEPVKSFDRFLNIVKVQPGGHLLDVPCGFGVAERRLLEKALWCHFNIQATT